MIDAWNDDYRAFRRTQAGGMVSLGTFAGGHVSAPQAASADGSVVVGWAEDSHYDDSMFRWTQADGLIPLGDLPGGLMGSSVRDVSGDGLIVVGESSSARHGESEAFIRDAAHGMRGLADLLVGEYGLDLTGWWLESATAISADGTTIVGYGTNPSGDTEAWRAVIPEPAMLGLLAVGGMGLIRRRRRRL